MSLIPFILDLADELHEFSRCLANGIDINDFGFGLYNGSDQQQPLQHQHQQQQQPSPRRSRTSSFSSFWMPSKRHHPYNRIKTACCAKSSEEAVATSEKLDAAPSSIGGTPAGKSASYSVVNKNGFQVSMNVKQFAPNELSVKTIDNCIVVEGRHDDKEDGHGVISRHFVRKYMLPKGYDPNDVLSTLSSDGILTVKAPPPPPPLAAKNDESNERIIEIQPTLGPTPVLVVSAKETPSKETTRKGPMASTRLECQLPEKRQKLDLPAEPESKETATPIPATTIPPLPSSLSTINEIPASAAATTTAEDESNDVEMEKAEGAEQITDIYIKQSEQQKSDVAAAEYRGKKKSETYAEEKKQIIVETENTFLEETKSESNGNAKDICEEMTVESCNNVTDATFVEKDCEIPSETTIKANTITEKSNATKMEVDEDNNINAEGNIDKTENTDHTDHIVNNKTSDTVKTIIEKDTEKTNNIDTSSSSNGNSTTTITTTVNNKNTSTNIATTTNTGTTSDITENPIKGGGNDGNGVVTGKIPVDIPESADNDATSADVTAAATVATAETKAESVIDGGETDMETAVVVNTDTVTNVIDDVALLKAATADPTDITSKGDEENVILAESIDGITTTDTTTITDSVECSLFAKKTHLGNGNNATTTLVGAEEMAN